MSTAEVPGTGVTAAGVRDAYRRCEEITWTQARNFSYGIRLLPPPKRHALAAVYALARRIDDIGDGDLPAEQKLAGLAQARATLADLMSGKADSSDPVMVALADAAGRFDLPLAAFGELIDGCEADVRGTTYRTFDDLLHYCRCVAGSIGRLSLGVFGTRDPGAAVPLADSLGVALQLTNILRDIKEDYANGRVYLPAEDFERFGASLPAGNGTEGSSAPGNGVPGNRATANGTGETATAGTGEADGNLVALVEFEAARAREWYMKGLTLMPLLDRRSAASAGAMAGIYFRLLEHIVAAPAEVLSTRVSLPASEKLMVAVKSLAGTVLRPPGPRRPAGPGPGPAAGGAA